MTERPTLALLIPAYNAETFLPRLLRSAAAQTRPFDQIWVYDDCSTDQTGQVAQSFGARVVRGEVNRGCSAGKNVLAREATTDWIHFHDADDELKPNFVELASHWMRTDLADVVLFPYDEQDEQTGAHLGVRRYDPADVALDARAYAIREQINSIAGLYRRAGVIAAGGYDEDPAVLYNEDVAFHIRLAFAGLRFAAETEIAMVTHRRATSMSSANALKCAQAQYEVLLKTAARPDADAYSQPIAERLWRVAAVLASHLDWATADAAVALARRISPAQAADGSAPFRVLAGISPALALRFREYAIRLLKPALR